MMWAAQENHRSIRGERRSNDLEKVQLLSVSNLQRLEIGRKNEGRVMVGPSAV